MGKKKLSGLLVYFWANIASLALSFLGEIIPVFQEIQLAIVGVVLSLVAVAGIAHAAGEYREFEAARNYNLIALLQ